MDAGATTASAAPAEVVVEAAAAPIVSAAPASPGDVIERWNDAHVRHDAAALEALYADKVDFYGARLSNVECAKRKAAAFAKAPDFVQSIADVTFHPLPTGKFVALTKTTTTGGKSQSFSMYIALDASNRVSLENDFTTMTTLERAKNWCFDKNGEATNEVRAPFRISAKTAVDELTRHPLFERFKNGYENSGVSIVTCPASCGAGPRACTFLLSMFRSYVTGPGYSDVAYVDAKTNVLSYEEAGVWKSEPLGGD